ncbi:MAG: hypothetical protein A2Z11_02800 [Candidatus Woykebacteria bacterium RBG_16_43_9]|uniref:Uncharacterized protein n=1 Tax=Candidatus Woykebacteria bacterium RBG_16_43_9 TaxID=1802596 RepID=A0A1G1WC44_9BACT|nr:MAG: hypothetical protein A2Z11_02800 [Candidatus Woykebacteria bacterium RBG_16_43_9]
MRPNKEDSEKIEAAKRTALDLFEARSTTWSAAGFTRSQAAKVNARWEALIIRLLALPRDDHFMYSVFYDVLMTRYGSFTEDLGIEMFAATQGRFWMDRVEREVWNPLVYQLTGLTQDQHRQYLKEYTDTVI